jgi:phenylpropionate dioxygenase-like ring-hydroxylating dioxygenase large terminal subunit
MDQVIDRQRAGAAGVGGSLGVRDIYLRGAWYVAALSGEIADNLLRRVILDEPVLLFRDELTGEPAALRDICPHRFASLSLGKRVAGGVQCPYHGLVFSGSGQCVSNPHGTGRIPPAAKVQAFPVAERHGLIWLWAGDPGQANPDLIPDLGFMDAAAQRTRGGGRMVTRANYQIMTDNILDLSHADFLHPMLDSGGGTRREPPNVEELADGSITVSWSWGPMATLGFLAGLFDPGAEVYTGMRVLWRAPGVMHHSIMAAARHEDLDRSVRTEAMHIMTPETRYTTHYFWGGVRNFDVDNDAFTAAFAVGVEQAFGQEDKPMIEAAQMNMGAETDIFALRPLGLTGDAGGVRARRKLQDLIAKEQGVGC